MKFYQSLVKGQLAALELSDEGLRVGRGFSLIQSSRKALLGAGSGETKGEFQDHPALSDPAVGETLCKQRVSEWISSALDHTGRNYQAWNIDWIWGREAKPGGWGFFVKFSRKAGRVQQVGNCSGSYGKKLDMRQQNQSMGWDGDTRLRE